MKLTIEDQQTKLTFNLDELKVACRLDNDQVKDLQRKIITIEALKDYYEHVRVVQQIVSEDEFINPNLAIDEDDLECLADEIDKHHKNLFTSICYYVRKNGEKEEALKQEAGVIFTN